MVVVDPLVVEEDMEEVAEECLVAAVDMVVVECLVEVAADMAAAVAEEVVVAVSLILL